MISKEHQKGRHNLFDLKHLNKSKVIWLSILWLLAVACCIISMSDFFTHTVFTKRFFTLWIILIVSTYTIIKIHINFNRQRKMTNKNSQQ